jgi:hypothetical protein
MDLITRDSVTRFFASGFFLESVSPKSLIIPLGPFRIFSKIRGDIHNSRFATGVNDTGGKWKKLSSRKILMILFGHLSLTPVVNLPPVSLIPVVHLDSLSDSCPAFFLLIATTSNKNF